jgi:hypothetical protein
MLLGLCRSGIVSIVGAWRIALEPLAPAITRNGTGITKSRGLGSVALAFFIRVLPKVGPLKVLSFEAPVPQAEQRFEDSFDRTRDLY